MEGRASKRAAVFAALAQGMDLSGVRERFRLTSGELRELFQEAADLYQDREEGYWRLYCDGASRGNPGPAGAGVVLIDPQGRERVRQGRYLGRTTNNVAEYQALLLGLEEAHHLQITRLQVFADSELLVKQLTGRYRVKSPHLLPLWNESRQALQRFEAYTITHIPREENREADAAANQAIDQRPLAR